MMRVSATADNLLTWATPMTASPISGAHSEIGLIESAYEPESEPSDTYATGYTYATDFPTTAGAAQGLSGGGSDQSDAFVTAFLGLGSGDVPWHPHSGGPGAIGGGVDVRVDLADGHVDVGLAGLSIPGRGPDLTVNRTWDSALAQGGTSGLSSSLTPTMGGALQGTVVYTDGVGTVWAFPYTGSATATPPYTAYRTPAGQPWQLATSTAGYTLTNVLTDEVWTFDASGRLLADQDSYGNRNSMSYGAGSPTSPSSAVNSGGRALTLGYTTRQLTAVQSPAWASSGGAQGHAGDLRVQRRGATHAHDAGGRLDRRGDDDIRV